MSDLRNILALGGPGHLQVIQLGSGQQTFKMADASEDRNPVQVFTYRIVLVGAGAHTPIPFLVPAHLKGEQKHIAAWVFNQLVQALMNPHPMANNVLLLLGFVVSSPDPHTVNVRAEVRAHSVGHNGVVRLAPIDFQRCDHRMDKKAIATAKQHLQSGYLRSITERAMTRALQPLVDRAVDQVMKHEGWNNER